MGQCPLCGQPTFKASTRLIKDACGHTKCRLCLLQEETGCSVCKGEKLEKLFLKKYSIDNSETSNYENDNNNPLGLINKVSDKSSHISCLTISRTCIIKKGNLNIQSNKCIINGMTKHQITNEDDQIDSSYTLNSTELNQVNNIIIEPIDDNTLEKFHCTEGNKNKVEKLIEWHKENEDCIQTNSVQIQFIDENYLDDKFKNNDCSYIESRNALTGNVAEINRVVQENETKQLTCDEFNKTSYNSICKKNPNFILSDYVCFKKKSEKAAPNKLLESPTNSFGCKSPDFQLSDYILLKSKSVSEENAIEAINDKENADYKKLDIASLPLIINLNPEKLDEPFIGSPSVDKSIIVNDNDNKATEEKRNEDERVNYDHLKCYKFPSYCVLEETLRSEGKLTDAIGRKKFNVSDSEDVAIDCVSASFTNNSECPDDRIAERGLKSRECDGTDINENEGVEDEEDKEKGEKEASAKEENNVDLMSLAKADDLESLKRESDKESKQPEVQSKKSDSQLSIKVEKRKRKRKVLFYEGENESEPKCPSAKRRRQTKDWSHIIKLPGSALAFKCTICEKIFKSPRGKWYHAGCLSGEPAFRCDLCHRTFAKRSHYEYHERMHTGHKPFACNVCDKSFVQKSKLNRHLLIHKQQNDIECTECGRRFSTKQYLKNHMSIHQNNSYKCKFCPKTFTLAFNRKRHERSHSTDRPYKCDICSKDFKGKFLLTRHRRTHDKSRPFSCHDCHRVFLSKFEVQRHMSVHSDVKPYSCTQCNLEFRRKDNLNRHIKHHHMGDSGVGASVANDTKSTEEDQAGSTEKPASEGTRDGPGNEEGRQPVNEKCTAMSKNIIEKPTTANNSKLMSKQKRISRLSSNSELRNYKNSSKSALNSPQSHRQIGSQPDLSNAVPVIRGPISIKRFAEGGELTSFTQPITPEEAVVLNRQIEEKIYTQDSFCNYPGLNRRASFVARRRDSNSKESDGAGLACKSNLERSKTVRFTKEEQSQPLSTDEPKVVKDINLHWRRRTAESLKTKITKLQA